MEQRILFPVCLYEVRKKLNALGEQYQKNSRFLENSEGALSTTEEITYIWR